MTCQLFSALLVGCLCVAMLGVSSAKAADGRIVFTGAVVEPTCTATSENIAAMAPASGQSTEARHFTCAGSSARSRSANRSYSLLVSSLAIDNQTKSPLLAYFVGYLQPSERATAKLVTQTYQ